MTITHQRLDRFISKYCNINRKAVKLLLAQNRVSVDGHVAKGADLIVNKFSKITLNNQVIQENIPTYLMLHKPVGVVSATKSGDINELLNREQPEVEQVHQTVIDLLTHDARHSLHIVGRLDLNTSGLMLLTDDSRWSKKLTDPENKVEKRYRVTLQNKLTPDYVQAFAKGFYFDYEGITTRPAKLEIVSDHVALVTLIEGRYHQIKRMFGRYRNPVIALHREAIGPLLLSDSLKAGESRLLTPEEVALF